MYSIEILLVPAQPNVALLVDKFVLRGQTFESIIRYPATVAEILLLSIRFIVIAHKSHVHHPQPECVVLCTEVLSIV